MKKCVVNLENIAWPKSCAYCNGDAHSFIQAKSTAVKNATYFVFFLQTTNRVITLKFPVCKKHKLKAYVASKLSQRSMLYLGMGVMSVILMLAPLGDLYRFINNMAPIDRELGWRLFLYCYPVVYWAVFFWAKNNSPIIIEDQKNEVVFSFKDDDFADAFIRLNQHS